MYDSVRVSLSVAVLLLSLLFTSCKQDDPVIPFVRLLENQKMYSTYFDNDITYAVLLPDGYDASTESYPVVYLLHGYGDSERAWYTSGGLQYYSDQYAGDIVPMIYVMPAAYFSYYVNRFSGDYPYMDMMTEELVPTIDNLYRTKRDKDSRAVMGYSMGGYGALILPALHPDIFSVAVPLSMSFRTDEQYLAETQDVFNSQWGLLYGGFGATGMARLTDYFKAHSPFHFFTQGDLSRFDGLKILLDCGDDEESLSITSDNLHKIMRDNFIAHEYRVRNGGHSFDYWKKSYPEAFRFISNAFQNTIHPTEPLPIVISPIIEHNVLETLEVDGVTLHVMTPVDYTIHSSNFPVLYLIHDFEDGKREENVINIFSMLRNNMQSGKLTKSIVVELSADDMENNLDVLAGILSRIDSTYRTKVGRSDRVLLGNEAGGDAAISYVSANAEIFGSCFLFNATLVDTTVVASGETFYYLDATDECNSYAGHHQLYAQIRKDDIEYEYRVRQGAQSHQAFLNGLDESLTSLKKRLMN
ncbi:MAG: esterase family protein [Bacteroidota bacterium]|nr:esterase family protein [Bacteroidota bacterium]